MPKNIRLHELAKELGMTNKETLDLSVALGIGVKSHSSSIEEPQADRVRRKAERDGLTRAEQPPEPEKPKKAVAKKTGAKSAQAASPSDVPEVAAVPATESVEPVVMAVPVVAPPVVEPAPAASPVAATPAPPVVVVPEPVVAVPVATPAPMAFVDAPVPVAQPAPAVEAAQPSATPSPTPAPAAAPSPSVIRSRHEAASPAQRPALPGVRPPSPPSAPTGATPVGTSSATPGATPRPPAGAVGAPARTAGPPPGAAPGASSPARPPMSASGRPIPPPPRAPLSPTGRPIPPPPGGGGRGPSPITRSGPGAGRPGGPGVGRPGGPGVGRPAGGPGGFARPGGPGARPGGPGAGFARPGGPGAGPGGPGAARPGGPGGGPGGPGGGPGGPANRGRGGLGGSQRRASKKKKKRRRSDDDLQPSEMRAYSNSAAPVPEGTIVIERGASAQDFAPKLNRTSADVVRFLLQNGEMVTATMSLSDEQMELFALEVGAEVLLVEPGQEHELELQAMFNDDDYDDEESQEWRPPVITVMGHVDHGKTLLLDRIRSANVVAGEAGGITQHIGAYQVEHDGRKITFIDTPGHQAFTKMRARGAEVTDIVILMVAADDGVMPTTLEALSHARAAEVPIVVAINKIDRENADPVRVRQELSEHGLVPEEWGGDTIMVEMSALQNLGIDDLLEQLLVVAEFEELTANPVGRAKGVVLEANLDVGRGPVATILVEKGTLNVGDPIVAGAAWGSVRAMIDDKGNQVKSAGPSTPVQVLGLSMVPNAGDEFRGAPDLKTARTVGEAREQRQRLKSQRGMSSVTHGAVKLEDVFAQIQKGETATLNLIVKADVQGSLEAVTESLKRLERDDVKLSFVLRGVGGITENDIQLAATTNATILGFNVRPDRKGREMAQTEHVDIRTYEIIYKLLEDIEAAMVGMLSPEYEEVVTGEAEVRDIFKVPKIGSIAGCMVRSGVITRGTKVRFLREGTIIWKGAIQSLRRFKDDVREVREGFECGIGLSDFQDLKPGDLIETFEERLIPRV